MIRIKAIPVFLFLVLSGCTGSSAVGDGWVHETHQEGQVKTVRTVSGSVWGGTATLVEEASIGVLEGADEYMLGNVSSLCAYDGRIYLIDRQVPVIRMYDYDGTFIGNIGRQGGGPGEYDSPSSIRISPVDGTVFVRDGSQGRLNVYSADGESIDTWPLRSGYMTSNQLVVTPEGHPYTYVWAFSGDNLSSWKSGMARVGPEGVEADTLNEPEFDFDEWTIEARNENSWITNNVPFSPTAVSVMSPLRMMIGGVSTDYSFQIFHPDGRVTVIEKEWERIPNESAEQKWYKARATANMRNMIPGWAWNGREIPNYKPPFEDLLADGDGRVWVRRLGPGIHLQGCDPEPEDSSDFYSNPCWQETFTMEVFDIEGRFLGEVDIPEGFQSYPEPYIHGDMILAVIAGDEGVEYVKRFRLQLPEEDEQL